MKKIYIVSACRTPIGGFLGTLKLVSAVELASLTVKENLKRAKVQPEWIDEVICGTVLSAGQGMGPARQVALNAGIPTDKVAYTLNMVCGSGMKSIIDGVNHIQCGYSDIVVAAGMENMSQSPYIVRSNVRTGTKYGELKIEDLIQVDGLTDSLYHIPMGETAESIAEYYKISRLEQDEYALNSHQKAAKARKKGLFSPEIIPVNIQDKQGERNITEDSHIRDDISLAQLGKLNPIFRSAGTVTAGNSSGINDGASSVILASEDAVKKYSLKPMAEVVSFGDGGVDPRMMGLGPIPAIKKTLSRAGLHLNNIELFEINEAFSAQILGVINELSQYHNIPKEVILRKLNVNGGAIALGHPLGCSGNRIVVSLLHSMLREKKEIGLASLCIGGGMGISLILKKTEE